MPLVTFQVLEGIDKGRIFREMPTPVTIGREEGNMLRLNDERVSRFHAKVQHDNGEIILTDLESTNVTRVNGTVIQIRRLRPGDRVSVGRSLLLFGSQEEIAARQATLGALNTPASASSHSLPATLHAGSAAAHRRVTDDMKGRQARVAGFLGRHFGSIHHRPLVFGSESMGLPDNLLTSHPHESQLRIPTRAEVRSLNLSNAVALVVYEAWRQNGFSGSGGSTSGVTGGGPMSGGAGAPDGAGAPK